MKFVNFLMNSFVVVVACESAALHSNEISFETSPLKNVETLTESAVELQSDDFSAYTLQPLNSEETLEAILEPGTLFRLKLTIVTQWNDEFLQPESKLYQKLANEFGSELIDFIDNSKEAQQPNITNFSLVEVLPSTGSSDKIYATFVVSSQKVISGQELKDLILNQINIYGSFYEHKVTNEGFLFDAITIEEAENYGVKGVFCEDFTMATIQPQELENAPTLLPNSEEDPTPNCKSLKTENGLVSVYVLESNKQKCMGSATTDDSTDQRMQLSQTAGDLDGRQSKCSTTTYDEEETVLVIRKRRNQIVIEL